MKSIIIKISINCWPKNFRRKFSPHFLLFRIEFPRQNVNNLRKCALTSDLNMISWGHRARIKQCFIFEWCTDHKSKSSKLKAESHNKDMEKLKKCELRRASNPTWAWGKASKYECCYFDKRSIWWFLFFFFYCLFVVGFFRCLISELNVNTIAKTKVNEFSWAKVRLNVIQANRENWRFFFSRNIYKFVSANARKLTNKFWKIDVRVDRELRIFLEKIFIIIFFGVEMRTSYGFNLRWDCHWNST